MAETYTPGRLHVGPPGRFSMSLNAENGHGICEIMHCADDPGFANKELVIDPNANARRLVACWNACLDIPTEALEAGVVKDLLEACKAVYDALDTGYIAQHSVRADRRREKLVKQLAAAIAKAEPKGE